MDDCIGAAVEERISSMGNGDVMLLENVRFHPGEEVRETGQRDSPCSLALEFEGWADRLRWPCGREVSARFVPSPLSFPRYNNADFLGEPPADVRHVQSLLPRMRSRFDSSLWDSRICFVVR